jgi:hypothetical protein
VSIENRATGGGDGESEDGNAQGLVLEVGTRQGDPQKARAKMVSETLEESAQALHMSDLTRYLIEKQC